MWRDYAIGAEDVSPEGNAETLARTQRTYAEPVFGAPQQEVPRKELTKVTVNGCYEGDFEPEAVGGSVVDGRHNDRCGKTAMRMNTEEEAITAELGSREMGLEESSTLLRDATKQDL